VAYSLAMSTHKLPLIEIGYQVFTSDGGEEVGAVRQVVPNDRPEIVVYIENTGDFVIPLSAVIAVHSQKVIVDVTKVDARVQVAIGRAHDAEKSRA
jgi:hypothetical protein